MKKWLSLILLIVFLFPATGHARKNTGIPSQRSFNEVIAQSSVESFGLAAFHIHVARQVSRNTTSLQGGTRRHPAFHTFNSFSAFFLPVEMFGNTRCCYNYPSHHFW